jgi:hypothetical protein
MTTITIRAADSAEALEEVMRRLGPDALILSTRQSRGMVEMVAGMAGIAENRQSPPRSNFRAELERVYPDLDEAAQVPEQDAAALSLPDRPPEGTGDAVLPPHLSGRVVLVGPPGAGRSLLAARLAGAALRERGGSRPVLMAPRRDLLTGDGPLAGWARLMGLSLHRPVWAQGLPAQMPPPDSDALEIIDLSAMGPIVPQDLHGWRDLPDTAIWLVLPTGLHPACHARLCPPWAGIARLIALTRADLCPPTAEDHALHDTHGIAPRLIATGTGVLDTLAPLPPPELADQPPVSPAATPCEDPSDAATRLS